MEEDIPAEWYEMSPGNTSREAAPMGTQGLVTRLMDNLQDLLQTPGANQETQTLVHALANHVVGGPTIAQATTVDVDLLGSVEAPAEDGTGS